MIGRTGRTIKVTSWGDDGNPPEVPFSLNGITPYPVSRFTPFDTDGTFHELDYTYIHGSGSLEFTDQQIQIDTDGTVPEGEAVWSSSRPEVGSISEHGFVTHHIGGSTVISLTLGAQTVTYELTLVVGTLGAEIHTDSDVGSLALHCSDAVDDRIAGKSFAVTSPLYTTQDHTGSVLYVRNPDFWAADLASKLTAISPYNSELAHKRAGTAISPIHIAFAEHWPIANNTIVRFIEVDGTVVDRKLMTSQRVGSTDIMIGVLEYALPTSITPMKVLPSDYYNQLPHMAINTVDLGGHAIHNGMPLLALDQWELGTVVDLGSFDGTSHQMHAPSTINKEKRLEFYKDKIDGDSGNPACLIVNDELVLMATWFMGGAGSGSSFVHNKALVNQTMIQLGGTYQLDEVDLSGFTNYGA